MKRYVRALCALLACVMLAGCEKAPDPAVTTAAPTATATASAETATTTAVTTTAEDGRTETKTVTAHYERGKSFAGGLCLEDYEKNGYPLVAVYDTERNPNKPYFYFPSNVVEIYFSYDSYKESEEFIAEHSDIIEKKVGENNTIDLKQVKLVKPFTDKDSITYEEYIELQKGLEQQLKELSPIVDLASFYKIHINMRPDTVEPE